MTSIGKFLVAGVAATQESTLALANINFDFSLVKMEAPWEYRGLGTALSRKRKIEAEEGSTHITARKLGALFADDLPNTSGLARAYGLRVSQIAENPKFNPQGSAADGPFVEHVGADGTSIWAAATSGRGALAVHLLACLLARVWSGPEAISIRCEIIAARKQLLQHQIHEQQFHIGAITACQIDIGREKLSEWDASARSWLRTANAAMYLQQTQLMLILENVEMPVTSKPGVYEQVMNVWKASLRTAENLVTGVAQSLKNGEPLLGLSAWHLYPDICALGQKSTVIRQKDSLIQDGGLMTIGLRHSPSAESTGISWSMPLSTLRFYGKPVKSRRDIGSSTTRIPFDRFVQTALGSILSAWQNRDSDLDKVAKFLVLFADAVRAKNVQAELRDQQEIIIPWPELLSQLSIQYSSSTEHEKGEIARYIALGRRRCGAFLADKTSHPAPYFSLGSPDVYLQMVEPEKRIAALRDMAKIQNPPFGLETAIIRFVHPQKIDGHPMVELATLVPQSVPGLHEPLHRRWIILPEQGYPWTKPPNEDGRHHDRNKSVNARFDAAIQRSLRIMRTYSEPCGFINASAIKTTMELAPEQWRSSYTAQLPSDFSWDVSRMSIPIESLVDHSPWADEFLPPDKRLIGWQTGMSSHHYEDVQYRFAFGDISHAAVYQPYLKWRHHDYTLPIDFVSTALETQQLNTFRLFEHFECFANPAVLGFDTPDYFLSLIALARAHKTYEALPEAEIDLKATSRALCSAKWAKKYFARLAGLDRSTSFACVALFDTGFVDIDPDDLVDVLAVSSTNTLYASELLFQDPINTTSSHVLRHVIGNVGKAGLALLVSPRDTMLRDIEFGTWALANHTKFDGKLEDNLASTSLHLSLTGYEQPLNTKRHGDRDQVAVYVEAVVSAYERGVWVADLDLSNLFRNVGPVKQLKSPFSYVPTTCTHDSSLKTDSSVFDGLTSIDSWYEYLDRPPNNAIIRARDNWAARLAFAAITLPEDEKLIVSSKKMCWACAKAIVKNEGLPVDRQLFLC